MRYQTVTLPAYAPVLQILGQRDSSRLQHYRAEDFKDKTVLDVGCASGMDSIWIAATFQAKRITGIDVDADCLAEARLLAQIWNVGERADFSGEPPWGRQFDVIIVNSIAKWFDGTPFVPPLPRCVVGCKPAVVYVESHSEDDRWTNDLLEDLRREGFNFDLLSMLTYTIADPRPIRRFFRGTK